MALNHNLDLSHLGIEAYPLFPTIHIYVYNIQSLNKGP